MSETSRRVRAPGYDDPTLDFYGNADLQVLAREVETLERSRGNDGLWCANVGEHDSIKAKLAEAERKVAALRSALLLHVTVYGGADHHKDDCEDFDTCLQCQASAAARLALSRG